jgi:hypothetical protein
MAKKAVANLRDKTKGVGVIKIIRAVKSAQTGNYSFKEDVVLAENAPDFLKNVKA